MTLEEKCTFITGKHYKARMHSVVAYGIQVHECIFATNQIVVLRGVDDDKEVAFMQGSRSFEQIYPRAYLYEHTEWIESEDKHGGDRKVTTLVPMIYPPEKVGSSYKLIGIIDKWMGDKL